MSGPYSGRRSGYESTASRTVRLKTRYVPIARGTSTFACLRERVVEERGREPRAPARRRRRARPCRRCRAPSSSSARSVGSCSGSSWRSASISTVTSPRRALEPAAMAGMLAEVAAETQPDHLRMPLGEPGDHLPRIVRAAVVDQDNLELPIPLPRASRRAAGRAPRDAARCGRRARRRRRCRAPRVHANPARPCTAVPLPGGSTRRAVAGMRTLKPRKRRPVSPMWASVSSPDEARVVEPLAHVRAADVQRDRVARRRGLVRAPHVPRTGVEDDGLARPGERLLARLQELLERRWLDALERLREKRVAPFSLV